LRFLNDQGNGKKGKRTIIIRPPKKGKNQSKFPCMGKKNTREVEEIVVIESSEHIIGTRGNSTVLVGGFFVGGEKRKK